MWPSVANQLRARPRWRSLANACHARRQAITARVVAGLVRVSDWPGSSIRVPLLIARSSSGSGTTNASFTTDPNVVPERPGRARRDRSRSPGRPVPSREAGMRESRLSLLDEEIGTSRRGAVGTQRDQPGLCGGWRPRARERHLCLRPEVVEQLPPSPASGPTTARSRGHARRRSVTTGTRRGSPPGRPAPRETRPGGRVRPISSTALRPQRAAAGSGGPNHRPRSSRLAHFPPHGGRCRRPELTPAGDRHRAASSRLVHMATMSTPTRSRIVPCG